MLGSGGSVGLQENASRSAVSTRRTANAGTTDLKKWRPARDLADFVRQRNVGAGKRGIDGRSKVFVRVDASELSGVEQAVE